MIACKLYLKSTLFHDTTIISYEIELPPYGKKIGLNLLNGEYFTIPYVIDTIPSSPAVYQLPTQANKIFGSFLSMEKSPSHIKLLLMNSSATRLDVENTSVYAEGRPKNDIS